MPISRYVPATGKIDYLKDVWESELQELADGLDDLIANIAFDAFSYNVNLNLETTDAIELLKEVNLLIKRESVFEGGD